MRPSIVQWLGWLIGAGLAATSGATEWIVDGNGDGDFTTIQQAADAAGPGDTVRIRAGVYSEMVSPAASGTATYPIVYRSFGDGEVVIDGGGVREACIAVRGHSHLRFADLALSGSLVAGFYAEGPAEGIGLDELEVTDILHPQRAVGYGMYFYALPDPIQDVEITGCTVSTTSSHGIFLYGRNYDFLIAGNEVGHNGLEEGDWGHSVKAVVWHEHGQDNGPIGVRIIDNELHHAWTQGIMTWNARQVLIRGNHLHHHGATGIQIEDGTREFVVEGNLSEWNQQHYSTETGIWIDDADLGVVRNNLLRHNQVGIKVSKSRRVIVRNNTVHHNNRDNPDHLHNGGLFLLAYDGIDCSDITIVHNTFYSIGNPAYTNATIGLFEFDAAITGTLFWNNIVADTVSGPDLQTDTVDWRANFNDWFSEGGFRASWLGEEMEWTTYLLETGQDASSKVEDPIFTDPDTGRFTLRATSPCIDSGGGVTFAVDSGTGTVVAVYDARFFTDGFGLALGDNVRVGANPPSRVVAVDYGAHQITVDRMLTWQTGQQVTYDYADIGPDMGAHERVTAIRQSGGRVSPEGPLAASGR